MSDKFSRIFFAVALLFCASLVRAQVSPFMGIGNAQFFDNGGAPLTAGVLYSYQAGTSTQQATFTDYTGLIQNPNPIPFGSGGRVSIWLTTASFYKFVLCAQNDGASCAPADVLFSVDQVSGGTSGSGSSSGTFTGVLQSSSLNTASSGVVRVASSDSAVCFRNTANSANLCIAKDSSDVLSWATNSFKLPEGSCSATGANFDYLCADSSTHRLAMLNNGGSKLVIAAQGVDINASDQVTQLHFGSTAIPLGAPPPTNSFLQWNGTNLVGTGNASYTVNSFNLTGQTTNCATQTLLTPSNTGFFRFSIYLVITTAAGTSSSTPQLALNFTDGDTNVVESPGNTSTVLTNGSVGNFVQLSNVIYAKAGGAITVSCTGYASNPSNAMTYVLRGRLEGPF